MARIHTVVAFLIVVVVSCVVAAAYPRTPPEHTTLTPYHHQAAGGSVEVPSWLGGRSRVSQDIFHTRKLSRHKRHLQRTSNWLKRIYIRTQKAVKKFFISYLWKEYRYITAVSSIFIALSTAMDIYFKKIGLIGSISTYTEFWWLLHELTEELKELGDEKCFYPTFWPIYKLAPDHCNPYRELLLLIEEPEQL